MHANVKAVLITSRLGFFFFFMVRVKLGFGRVEGIHV